MQDDLIEDRAARLLSELWTNREHPLTVEQTASLARYLGLLNHWNRVHSLTALSDLRTQVVKHLVDALAVWPLLEQRFGADPAIRVADVGSGMGVPGLVWAVVMPQSRFVLIERQQKKIAFLKHVVSRLGLGSRVAVEGRDVKNVVLSEPVDLIVSRAFAALGDFVHLTWNLSGPATQWAAMMGRPPNDGALADSKRTHILGGAEITQTQKINVPNLDAQRHLVWLQRSQ